MNEKETAKILNAIITDKDFVDKPLNDYIYASLSQSPIKILDKRNSNDELDYIVECPNCHSAVCYGTDIFMYSGHIYCSNEGCREEVVKNMKNVKNTKPISNEYVDCAKTFVITILRNDGDITIEGLNDMFEIQNGNKDVLVEHIKAIRNIMNKALEELERESRE